jgi:hypothetical protein
MPSVARNQLLQLTTIDGNWSCHATGEFNHALKVNTTFAD